ncbi:MAG: hypothetical protein IH956_03045, partial [Chloroflexi bacterium]|nr:hypothetical protein [Chloroflexota bacterium]
MKQSLKFLTIGSVLVLLLVSHVFSGRSVSAVPLVDADLAVDTVVWLDSAKNEVTFYKPSDAGVTTTTAVFFLKSSTANELETTPQAVATWDTLAVQVDGNTTLPTGSFRLSDGNTRATSTAAFNASNAATTTVPSTGGYSFDASATGYSTTSPATASPIVAGSLVTGAVKVGASAPLVTESDPAAGTFSLVSNAAIGAKVVATFKHHIIDKYEPTAAGGTQVGANDRAKVTSDSDSTGEWVTISEVSGLATTTTSATARFFRGTIILSADAGSASDALDGKLWVQDGDTLTVTYYKSDH